MPWDKMWTTTEPLVCTFCAKAFRSKVGRKVYVCKPCLLFYCPAMHAQSSFIAESVECGCCGASSSRKLLCQLWTTFCVPCSLALKHVESLQTQVSFLQQFNPCPLDDDFVGDISLIVGNTEIQAHRLILASKSPVFRTMMEFDKKGKVTGKIYIEGFSPALVQAAVSFMYTAEIDFNVEVTPQEVLRFSHRYQILWLKKLCEDALVKTISSANLVDLLSISYTHEAEVLKEELKKSLGTNPSVLSRTVDDIFDQIGRKVGRRCRNCIP